MADDTEVLRKGSELYNHLQENGFQEFEFFGDSTAPKKNEAPDYKYNSNTVSCYLQHQLSTILNSNLLLEEDSIFLQNFLHHEVKGDKSKLLLILNAMTIVGFLSLLSAMNLRLRIVVPIVFGLSPLTACCIKEGLALYTNSSYSKITLQLVDVLKAAFLLIKKSLLLIQENEFLGTNSVANTTVISWLGFMKNRSERTSIHSYYQLHSLRVVVGSVLISVIALFARSSLKFIRIMPLSIYTDSSCQYLSQEALKIISGKTSVSTLQELHRLFNCYLLLQSEFLKRFALCFCPEHWLKDSKAQWPLIFDVTKEIIMQYGTLLHSLKAEYTFHYIPFSDERKVLSNKKSNNSVYSDFFVTVHSLELHFKSLLIQSQILQDLVEVRKKNYLNYREPWKAIEDIDDKLNAISKELQSCQNCLQMSQNVLMKIKLTFPNCAGNNCEGMYESKSNNKSVIHKTGMVVGKSNFEPQFPDEVFLAFSNSNNIDIVDEAIHDVVQHNEYMEVTKNVLQELKEVLKEKQIEWEERERIALGTKVQQFPISTLDSETKIDKHNSDNVEGMQDDIKYESSQVRSQITFPAGFNTSSFTSQIAQASAAWNLSTAQNVSTFGETDEESVDEDSL